MTNIRKAVIASIVVLILIIGVAIASFAKDTGIINKEAKLRKTASDTSTILEIIPNKEEVEILEVGDEWYKVNYKKIKGYVKKEFIDVKENESTKTTETTNTIQETEENEQEEQTKQETSAPVEQGSNELKKGSKVAIKDNTNLHARPLINSISILDIEKGKDVEIITIMNNWAYVDAGSKMGWIELTSLTTKTVENKTENNEDKKDDKSKEETKTGYINVDSINFRKKADTESEIIDVLSRNDAVTILEEDEKWCKVKYKNQTGYIAKKYISDKKTQTTSRSAGERTATSTTVNKTTTKTTEATTKVSSNPNGSEIASYAKQFVGSKYVYGAASPSKGFDCSGLTMYVYSKFGKTLPHSSSSQANCGVSVSKSDLQPGDLVFFSNYKTGKGIGHVGIYIGNNQFVHASTEKTGVIISSLSGSSHAKRYVKAVRIIK